MNQVSPLEAWRDLIEVESRRGTPPREIVKLLVDQGLATSERSVRRALRRWSISLSPDSTGFKIEGDEAEVTSKPSSDAIDHEELLRSRGLDPDEWDVSHLTVNEWDSPTGEVMRQLKVVVRRKRPLEFLLPAVEAPRIRHSTKRPPERDHQLVVFVGDQQAPYHDPQLHDLFCNWLEYNQPEYGVLLGDTVDFPDISRHPENPEWHVTAQECINAGYLILRDYVEASPTDWTKLCGNHDERIRTRLLSYMTNLYGIRPADKPDQSQAPSAMSVRTLLHLDALGIEYIEPKGSYTHAQVKISDFLAARHGWIATKGGGSSALKTLEHLGFSVVVGHSHRQSLVHKTTHDINGSPYTLVAAESGCMCKIRDGLGFTVAPDWQQGFCTGTLWNDGTFKLDLATYIDGKLYYRDQRF